MAKTNQSMKIASGKAGNMEYYRKKWREHQNGTNVIKDKEYLKNLQEIILYPDRFGIKDA
tara:strand:- start:163 stop:342 length:180 start_codon:yes stop_codon:yes gene_type:complete